ncbi:MAG: hypothetical protein KAI47_12970, partial [Deltaproteobacteria bacterium]|nr:hypothetical protein [Deltaproteobacteria bacterium]
PTSKVSQGQSMMMTLSPGVMLSRGFKLHSGKYFNKLTLIYSFRFSARLHEYQTAQVDSTTCSGLGVNAQDRPECVTSGMPNTKFRFTNAFTARLVIHPKVYLTLSVALYNDLKYELEATQYTGPSTHTHLAYVSSGVDVTVPVFDWLYLSVGANSFHNQLEDDSTLQVPFFNRFVNFYFDATIPIDKIVDQVQRWAS